MRKLAGKNVSRVIDLLNERLVFERSGVMLYDKVLERMRRDPQAAPMLEQMQEHRDEEKEHAAMTLEWLRRRDPAFDLVLRTYLFTEAPVVEVEHEVEASGGGAGSARSDDGSLGIGSLRERS